MSKKPNQTQPVSPLPKRGRFFGTVKSAEGWSAVEIVVDDHQVVAVNTSTPDLRIIATERTKLDWVLQLQSDDGGQA
jgi:hypothetical protein